MQGLADSRFAPTDEVKSPSDANWVALEEHPAFAETCADIEPASRRIARHEMKSDAATRKAASASAAR